jgi:hypothetical protein
VWCFLILVKSILVFEKIFSFRISEKCREPLCRFAEEFLQYHIDRRMGALEYYHAVAPPLSG